MRIIKLFFGFVREFNLRNFRRIIHLVREEGGLRGALIAVKGAATTVFQVNYSKPWVPQSVIEPSRIQGRISPGEVAFVIYCFFPEYLERIIALIEKFELEHPEARFYVASPDIDVVNNLSKAQTKFKSLIAVAHSENRGRNFGPMFVEFANAMKNYEYVIHLHSKRSSHSQKKKGELWANSLWRAMGEESQIIETFLQLLRTNSDIAIAYSLVEDLFPPRAFSWSANGSSVRAAFEAEVPQLRYTLDSERFPFPAGGMFIFRTSAFQDLLDKNWNYELFPEESGQLDGTAQHVVERLMGFIPYSKGHKQLVYLERRQAFTTDTSFIFD
jgi:lipopolysaccharide biosynthesis protein